MPRIAAIPGVAQVQTRVVVDVTLDVPDMAEPAIGRLISIPHIACPILNDLHLRRAAGSNRIGWRGAGERGVCGVTPAGDRRHRFRRDQ